MTREQAPPASAISGDPAVGAADAAAPRSHDTPRLEPALLHLLGRLQQPIWVFDIDHACVHWANASALEVWRAASLDELRARDMAADMSESVARRLRQYQLDFERADARFSELWTLYPRGVPRTLRVMFSGMRLTDGRMAMLCEAIGEQAVDPETLRSAEALLHTPVMITLYDERGTALYRNPAARGDVANPQGDLHQHFVDATDGDALLADLRRQGSVLEVCRVNTSDGQRWHRVSARRCLDAVSGREAWLFSEVDISDLKQVEARAQFLATHDSLTALPNRHFVNETFQRRLEQLLPAERSAALLFIDLDNFKQINDSLGHATGDQLLRAMAARLQRVMGSEDLVARLGGDEFLIFTPIADDETVIRDLATRLLATLARPLRIGHHELSITASIGVARFPRDGHDIGTLLREADLAMYGAKDAGRNRLAFYSESMLARAQSRLSLEIELRRALERREFTLHYQPRCSIADGRIVGAEALVRWNHPQRGLVLPGDFIALCEDTGLIVALGEQVFEQAAVQLRAWQQTGILQSLAINLSPRQFSSTALLTTLQRVVADSGCDPRGLELEITESVLLGNDDTTLALLQGVRELGCSVIVDDFGTGYSNLASLQRLPLSSLKIDRSFISVADTSRPLAEVIIALGHTLGLRVVAEGVETPEQLAWLRQTACDEFQGFLYSPAVPPDAFARLAVAGR